MKWPRYLRAKMLIIRIPRKQSRMKNSGCSPLSDARTCIAKNRFHPSSLRSSEQPLGILVRSYPSSAFLCALLIQKSSFCILPCVAFTIRILKAVISMIRKLLDMTKIANRPKFLLFPSSELTFVQSKSSTVRTSLVYPYSPTLTERAIECLVKQNM